MNASTVPGVGACLKPGSRKPAQDCQAVTVIVLREVMVVPSGRYFVEVNSCAATVHTVTVKLGAGNSRVQRMSEYEMSAAEMTEGLAGFPAAASA